jgi:hypothetical protein
LSTLQGFNENRWRPFTAFLLKIFDNVSSSGSGAGIAASSPTGSIWKGTKVSNLYDYFNYFFNNSGYFLALFLRHSRLVCDVETDRALS